MADASNHTPLRMEIPCQPTWFGAVRAMVLAICRRAGFEEYDGGQIALALDEALCNVLRHGYEGREDGLIELSIDARREPIPWISLVIADRGRQVDPATIQSRDLTDVRPGGLGVHLMQSVMDQCHWTHRDGGGMTLTMVKEGGADGATEEASERAR